MKVNFFSTNIRKNRVILTDLPLKIEHLQFFLFLKAKFCLFYNFDEKIIQSFRNFNLLRCFSWTRESFWFQEFSILVKFQNYFTPTFLKSWLLNSFYKLLIPSPWIKIQFRWSNDKFISKSLHHLFFGGGQFNINFPLYAFSIFSSETISFFDNNGVGLLNPVCPFIIYIAIVNTALHTIYKKINHALPTF